MMRLVVVGASGRMGSELIRTIATHEEVVLVGAVEQPQSVWIGRDAGEMTGIGRNGIIINGDDPFAIFSAADGVIDFTVPSASTVFASLTAQAGIVHIIGTTGFEPQQETAIAAAASLVGAEKVHTDIKPSMGSEDFSFMLQKRPGAYIVIGAGEGANDPPVHNPYYDFNDRILPLGAAYWVALVRQQLPCA